MINRSNCRKSFVGQRDLQIDEFLISNFTSEHTMIRYMILKCTVDNKNKM